MKTLEKTEIILLVILWTLSLTTYSVALLNNYILYASDYLGLVGLAIATLSAWIKPEKAFRSVLILLLLGLFNLISFVYFFNVVISFGFSFILTPGIQLISFILLSVLVIKKRDQVILFFKEILGRTEEEKDRLRQNAQNRFKTKFDHLPDSEIDSKLRQNLVPEAILALKEIKEERKNSPRKGA